MDNLDKASDYIKSYFQEKVLSNYSMSDWKETYFLKRTDSSAMLKKWSVLGKHFTPTHVEPEINSGDPWVASLLLQYMWRVKDADIPVRVSIFRDQVQFVQIVDMFNVSRHYGNDFDFIDEFKKTVELMLALGAQK